MKTFHLLVANTLLASVTNNFLWFALTFWVYLETRSVMATAIIGGGYMLLLAVSGMFFGTFVDRHLRKTSMLLSNALTLVAFLAAGAVYALAPAGSLQDLGHVAFWALVTLILAGAIAGNLRSVALATTVTLLVPEEEHAKANGLVGTVNGVAFAITSVFSGLAIGLLGMGACPGHRDRADRRGVGPSPEHPHHGGEARARSKAIRPSSTCRGRCGPFGSSPA